MKVRTIYGDLKNECYYLLMKIVSFFPVSFSHFLFLLYYDRLGFFSFF